MLSTRSISVDRHGRGEELQDEPLGLARRLAGGVLAQHLDVALGVRIGADGALEVGGVDDHVGAGELAELDRAPAS